MIQKSSANSWWLASLAIALPGLLNGCATEANWDRCATIPPGAMPAPVGTNVNRIVDAQAARAEADDFVIYHHEWYLGGVTLGPYGQYHVQQIAQRLPTVPFNVTIQATPDQQLNETRRKVVVSALTAAGLTDVDIRVAVGYPEAEGLYGEEAERAYQFMQQGGFNNFGGFGWGGMGGFGRGFGNFFGGGRNFFRGNLGLGSGPFF